MKTVKTVVRKLLHEVVKLSAVPIDPNLPPPIIKRPPPKVKQPPPPPKKRVGRDDIEMKKGDWLCPKCDFMNFAKNTVCLQCDAKRPKRQLLPGEWECPQCNFLNYRRNTVCFHCEHKRPPDTYTESQFPEKQRGPKIRMEKISDRKDISNAWNFDFDDDESDGADVAAFEGHEDGLERSGRSPKFEREYSDSGPMRNGVGFNDFDEEEDDDVDSYEMVSQNEVPETSQIDFSELEVDSESEDTESTEGNWHARGKTKLPTRGQKQKNRKAFAKDVELDFDTDDDLPIHLKWKSSHVANQNQQTRDRDAMTFGSDDDDLGFSSGSGDESFRSKKKGNRRGSNGMDRSRRRSSSKDESLSEADSGDDLSYRSDRQRDKAGLNRPGKASRGFSGKKSSASRGFNRSSGPKRNNRDFQENSYSRQAKTTRDRNMSEFSDYKRGGSFEEDQTILVINLTVIWTTKDTGDQGQMCDESQQFCFILLAGYMNMFCNSVALHVLEEAILTLSKRLSENHTSMELRHETLVAAVAEIQHQFAYIPTAPIISPPPTFAAISSVPPPPPSPPSPASPKSLKLLLPSFDGSAPFDWIFQTDQYFAYYQIPPHQRIDLTSFYIQGEVTLFKLLQRGSVIDFQVEFERICNRVIGLSPEVILNCFILGLRPDIQWELVVIQPSSISQAIGLAKLLELKALDARPVRQAVPLPPARIPALLPAPVP
ncbi:UNVERIFIED_CONTAM: Zinc finger protein VAR3, chloroplastic [Sesamum latifolium]|uniref:Zinc finger protein VAR3, chloroplastic n=1 Tax=Sesamum latifolium TaxID=2727402 RepID=A0AAW2X8J2_9LAMI